MGDHTDDEDFADIAGAVLDGGSPDGTGTKSGADVYRQAVIRQFQVLSEIVGVHRRPETNSPETEKTESPRDTLGTWGPLRLLERIGQGAFGDVYRAWDGGLDREVALKLLRPGAADRANRDTAVVEEGRLLAQVHHPNVLTVHGAARYDGRLGIWTEFIRGETLESRLHAYGPLPEGEVISIGLDVCRALGAVHEAGTLHRDIKAANVMRQETGRIVLMDFGTGRALADARADLSGTPLYLAPEIFSGAPPTVASDTYAVAVLLFHLLTGSYPVSGRALEDVRSAHASDTSQTLDRLRRNCSKALARVITRGLHRDSALRYQSAQDFERAVESARRQPIRTPVWAVAGLVVLLLAGGIWAVRAWSVATDLARRELLCADCGDEASISNDGRFLLHPDDATGDLEVLDLWRETRQRLFVKPGSWVESGGLALQPIWSPDGGLVAYRWDEVQNYQHLSPELRVAPTTGHPAPRVLFDHLLDLQVHDWSPDGRRVLVSVRRPNESGLRLAWCEIANGRETDLGVQAQRRARVSPDGRFIAYAAIEPSLNAGTTRGSMRLHVMAEDGSRDAVLGSAAVTTTGPVWTPDGTEIAYTSSVAGTLDLWSVRVADGHPADTPRLIRRNLGTNAALDLLRPDRYVYDQVVEGLDRVVIVPVGGSFPQTAADRAHNLFTGYRPRWSPDGTSLAFFRLRPSGESSDLVVRSVATGSERVVMVEPASPRPALFWFHDGASLLEQVPHGAGHPRLYRLNLRTGTTTRLGADFPADFARTFEAALSVDGKTLYTGATENKTGAFDRIVGIDLATGAVRQVVVLPNAHLGPGGLGLAASPDGRWLAIGIDRTRLAVVGVDGRGFREVPGQFASDSPFGQVGWMADSRSVLFGQVTPGPLAGSSFRVWRVPLSGEAPEPVTPAFNGPGVAATFDVSPDGSRLAIYPNASATQMFDAMAGAHDYVRQLVVASRPDRF